MMPRTLLLMLPMLTKLKPPLRCLSNPALRALLVHGGRPMIHAAITVSVAQRKRLIRAGLIESRIRNATSCIYSNT